MLSNNTLGYAHKAINFSRKRELLIDVDEGKAFVFRIVFYVLIHIYRVFNLVNEFNTYFYTYISIICELDKTRLPHTSKFTGLKIRNSNSNQKYAIL